MLISSRTKSTVKKSSQAIATLSSGQTTYLIGKEVMMVVTYQGQESQTNPTIVRFGFPVCENVTLLVSNAMVMAETEYQVWASTQFYYVDFLQSMKVRF